MSDDPHSSGSPEEPPELSLSQSKALIPLLAIFGLTVIAIFVFILRGETYYPEEGSIADKACGPGDFKERLAAFDPLAGIETDQEGSFAVPAPPFSEGIFPCSDCHEPDMTNPERRQLTDMHEDIVLKHDEENRWCLDCHDADDRDHLRLASGKLIPFTESYKLCGQCHGPKYRDWKRGIHGKRTGYWNGHKRYLLCVHCHNPHHPKFAKMKPFPPPVRPQFLRHDAETLGAKPQPRPAEDTTEESTHG